MESTTTTDDFGLKHIIFGTPSEHEFFLVPGICLSYEMFTKTYDDTAISWTEHLIQQGYRVHILDWQDFHPPTNEHFGSFISRAIANLIQQNGKPCTLITHSTSGAYGWKVLGESDLLKNIIAIAPAPPGNIQKSFPVEDMGKEFVFKSGEYTYHIDPVKGFNPDLLWVEEKLVAHGLKFPEDKFQDLLSICNRCDPRAIMERFNANDSQIKIDEDNLMDRQNTKVFVITGDNDPPHPYETDNGIVEYLKTLNVGASFIWLAEHNLPGHGHMMMMEKGSTEILKLVLNLISNP